MDGVRGACGWSERRRSQRETGPLIRTAASAVSSSQGTMCMKVICGVRSSTHRAADAADDGGGRDDGDQVAAQVGAQRPDGGELARPQRDGVGGVGLDGRDADGEHRGKGDEGAAAGHRVDHARDEGGRDQPEVGSVRAKAGKHSLLL